MDFSDLWTGSGPGVSVIEEFECIMHKLYMDVVHSTVHPVCMYIQQL